VYGNINNYHTIAGSGAFNGRTINVEGSTYGAFQHSANPAQKDLDDLGKLLDQMKNDYVQFSKDSFEKRGVELAVEAKILNKGDGFDDLLKKFKKYTKAEIADQQHVFDEILLIERKFTREVFANWAKRENLNVKITDPFFGSKNKRLTQPQKGYSGHSGYYFVQEAAGQVVKKVKDQTKAGARRMVNMRVRPSKGGIVEGATVKRPPHTSVLVDLVDEKSPAVVIKIEADQVKQSSQAKIAKQIIKKFSLSTDVESALKELVEGTYGQDQGLNSSKLKPNNEAASACAAKAITSNVGKAIAEAPASKDQSLTTAFVKEPPISKTVTKELDLATHPAGTRIEAEKVVKTPIDTAMKAGVLDETPAKDDVVEVDNPVAETAAEMQPVAETPVEVAAKNTVKEHVESPTKDGS